MKKGEIIGAIVSIGLAMILALNDVAWFIAIIILFIVLIICNLGERGR